MNYKSDEIIIDSNLLESFEQFLLYRRPFYPRFLELFLTDNCNHKCPFCISSDYRIPKKNIAINVAEKVVIQAIEGGTTSIRLCGGGEPLLHPQINQFLNFSLKNKIKFSLITNGHLITGPISELLVCTTKEIRISMDAGNDKIYSLSHGVSNKAFDKLIQNINLLISQRGQSIFPIIELSFVITDQNISSMADFLKLSSELKVDRVNITTNTNETIQEQNKKILIVKEVIINSDYNNIDIYLHDSPPDEFVINTPILCPAIILHGLINSEGLYYPSCHHLRNSNFILGKINESNSLSSLLSSDTFLNKQFNYIFKKGNKLKKMTHKLSNVILIDYLIKSAKLKEKVSTFLL